MIDADKLIDQIERKYGMDPMYFTDENTPEGRQAIIDAALIELLEQAASKSVSCANCKYGKEIHTGPARAIMCINEEVPQNDDCVPLYVDFDWTCPLGERRQDNGTIH